VDANRVEKGTGGAAAAMSYGGDAARSGKASREKLRWWASSGATRGAALEQEKALGGTARGPAAALSRGRGGGRGGRRGGGALRADLQNQKFEGPLYKSKFPHYSKAQMRKWTR
jgi:hypothetical protein